jgi:hypothetical protein
MPNDQIDTQDDDQQVVDQQIDDTQDTTGDTPSGDEGDQGTQADQDFLVVNDRTRYKTQEDAVAAYNEAGQRISELTPYAEIAERMGIADPATLQDILVDYQQLRQAAAKQQTREEQGQAPSPRVEAQIDSNLSDVDKKNIEYLKRLGYSPAEATVKALDDKITKLQQSLDQRFQQYDGTVGQLSARQQQAMVETGQSYLAKDLTDRGYDTSDPAVMSFLENSVAKWMEANSYTEKGHLIPGSPVDKAYKGGRSFQEAVQQGLDVVLAATNKLRIQADAKYQGTKQQKVARTAKPLPKGSQHGVDEKNDGARRAPRRPGAGGIFQNPDLHDKAFEVMKRAGQQE